MEINILTFIMVLLVLAVWLIVFALSCYKKDIKKLNERLCITEAQIKGMKKQLRKLNNTVKYLRRDYEI